MALIYADDFQQFAKNTYNTASVTNAVSSGVVPLICDQFEAMGFVRPLAYTWGVNYWVSAAYNTADGCMRIVDRCGMPRTIYDGTAQGLKRNVVQKGDTFYLSMRWASSQDGWLVEYFPGNFLELNDGLFTVGMSPNYTYTLNGVDTGYSSVFTVEVTQLLEIIVGPGYIELWNGDYLVARQETDTLPITNFRIGIQRSFNATQYPHSFMKLYSLIVADNSGTSFNTRIGRKLAKSVALATVSSTQSTLEQLGGATVAQTLQTPMQTMDLNTDATLGYGNVYSKLPYVKTVLFGSIGTPTKVYAAAVNVQAKRRELSNDGLGVQPYIKLATAEEYGDVFVPRGRWKAANIPMAITPEQTVNAIEFGFTHEYPTPTDKVYVDDRTEVEVYGNTVVPPYVPYMPYQNTLPTTANLMLQTPTYQAYVFDYAKSELDVTSTQINNLTFMQDI